MQLHSAQDTWTQWQAEPGGLTEEGGWGHRTAIIAVEAFMSKSHTLKIGISKAYILRIVF